MTAMSQRNSRRYNRAKRGKTATAVKSGAPTRGSVPTPHKPSGTYSAPHEVRLRVHGGTPAGGQFVAHGHDEAAVALALRVVGTGEQRRAADTEMGRFNQQFDDLDAFTIDDGEIVDVDLANADGPTMSSYQLIASYGYNSVLS